MSSPTRTDRNAHERSVTWYRWEEMPREKVSAMLDRRLITGDRMMLAHVYLKQGCIVPKHSHENEQFTYILDVQGIPRFFSPLDKALLRGFQTFGDWLPTVTVPLVKAHLRHETANVVLPAEPELLREHLAARRTQGVRMNLNFLGEALLGEEEAAQRLEKYLAALQLPEVEVLSVKIEVGSTE